MQEVLADSKVYENIAVTRSVNYPNLIRGIEIVRQFIRDRNLILYGGLSIDLSLKMRNHPGIYGPDIVPDYDIRTSDLSHANELADILHREGLPNISVISALTSPITRRVRIDFDVVADFCYTPANILAQIPVLEISSAASGSKIGSEKLRVVHPDFTRINIHWFFCTLYMTPPLEQYYNRYSKDVKRYKLLESIYPMQWTKTANSEFREVPIPDIGALHTPIMLSGLLAYARLLEKYEGDAYVVPVTISGGKLRLPREYSGLHLFNIVSWDPLAVVAKLGMYKNVVNSYLDNLQLRYFDYVNLRVYDSSGFLINAIRESRSPNGESGSASYSAQPHFLLCEFLVNRFRYPDQANLWLNLYYSVINMVSVMEYIDDPANPVRISSDYFGSRDIKNLGDLLRFDEFISDIRGVKPCNPSISKPYYPNRGDREASIDSTNIYFMIDAKPAEFYPNEKVIAHIASLV